MAENMSALHHTLVSIESDTGMACRRKRQLDAYPWPALCSLSVNTDTDPPVAAIRWYESSLSVAAHTCFAAS
jgi:hypothetical protein